MPEAGAPPVFFPIGGSVKMRPCELAELELFILHPEHYVRAIWHTGHDSGLEFFRRRRGFIRFLALRL